MVWNDKLTEEIELRYSAAVYYEMALPRWAVYRRWKAKREWLTWLHALRIQVSEDFQ